MDDMHTSRTYLTAVAMALAASAVANWHPDDAAAPMPAMQAERSRDGPGDTHAQAVYLPALFVDEERAARIEPMPPQF